MKNWQIAQRFDYFLYNKKKGDHSLQHRSFDISVVQLKMLETYWEPPERLRNEEKDSQIMLLQCKKIHIYNS